MRLKVAVRSRMKLSQLSISSNHSTNNDLVHNFEDKLFFPTLKKSIVDNEIIDTNVAVNKSEVSLAGLKFRRKYKLNNTATADFFRFANSLVGGRYFPENTYQLDKLFNSKDFLNFHAVCPKCSRYVKKFDESSNRYRDYFVIINVESAIKKIDRGKLRLLL